MISLAPKITKSLDLSTTKIHIDEVTKVYQTKKDSVLALDRVSMYVKDHEFVSIVGASGCGKSTLLRILAGLEGVSSGSVKVSGKEVQGPNKNLGMVFQSYTLFPWLTVRENIEFGLNLSGINKSERKERSDYYLEMVNLEPFANSFPKELSGGMKQRVAIARSLANQPDVLLMDEPFGALDAQTKENMQQLLLKIWRKEKSTIVFITHDIDEAIFLSQRIYVLKARPGRVADELNADLQLFDENGEIQKSEEFFKMKKKIISHLKH